MPKNVGIKVEFDVRKQNLAKPGRENWAADSEATQCTGCTSEFSFFVWKHHCRACGNIFCDKCTSFHVDVHRPHYTKGETKQRRVCATCFGRTNETRKALESANHPAPSGGDLSHCPYMLPKSAAKKIGIAADLVEEGDIDSYPKTRRKHLTLALEKYGDASPSDAENHERQESIDLQLETETSYRASRIHLTRTRSDSSTDSEPSVKQLLGLPKVNVVAVDHHETDLGKLFFFDPDEFRALVGEFTSKTWLGKTFYVVQYRGGERMWSGGVVVNRAGASCFGKRTEGEEYGQWQVGDVLLPGCSSAKSVWKVEDTIKLGTAIWMFDDTILRLDAQEYSSVTQALDALRSNAIRCDQGICIVRSSSQQEYFLLLREDQRRQGLHFFDDFQEFKQFSEEEMAQVLNR